MGRGKKKRKAKLKKRRLNKIKKGKNVSFTLANCPIKLRGRNNSYEYKINVHNCCFNDAKFNRVRYRAGHITSSYLRRANFNNIDFIFVNLKNSSFKQSRFTNVIFNGCNLTGVDFEGCKFEKTYFINCKIDYSTKEMLEKCTTIINTIEVSPSEELKKVILKTSRNSTLEKYRILTISKSKLNKAMLQVLLGIYSEKEIIMFITKAINSNRTQFYTLYDYIISIGNYIKK